MQRALPGRTVMRQTNRPRSKGYGGDTLPAYSLKSNLQLQASDEVGISPSTSGMVILT